jgi:hypothetical protein
MLTTMGVDRITRRHPFLLLWAFVLPKQPEELFEEAIESPEAGEEAQ